MRLGLLFVVAALLSAAACKSSPDKPAARKLRKMDLHTTVDDRGRLKLTLRMYDNKHELMPVTGSYSAEVTKLDGTVLCKAAGELAPADFSDKGTHQAPWHDASCPADPGVDELKVNVKVTVPGAGDSGKDDGKAKGDKGKDAAKDKVFDRSLTLPVKSVYERPPAKKPTETKPADGSAAKPADPSAAKPTDASDAKPADASDAKPADASAAKPAETKPAETKPAETKPAE